MRDRGMDRRRIGGVRLLDVAAVVGVLIGAGVLGWVLLGPGPGSGSGSTSRSAGAGTSGASGDAAGDGSDAVGGDGPAPTGTVEAVLGTVQDLVRQGQTSRAGAVLREAVGKYPGDQSLRLALADLLVSAGDAAGAYEQFEAALAIGPRMAGVEFSAGATAHMAGDLERAHEHFAAAQQREPSNAEYALRLGVVQIERGELDAGKATLLRVGVMAPERAAAWGQLAEVALRENKADLALDYVAKARAAQPEALAWRVIEARARKRLGDAEGAVELLVGLLGSPALREDEGTARGVLRTLGESYGLLGRPGDAAAAYAAMAESAPTVGLWAREAALWYERAGDAERAAAWEARAVMLGSASDGAP